MKDFFRVKKQNRDHTQLRVATKMFPGNTWPDPDLKWAPNAFGTSAGPPWTITSGTRCMTGEGFFEANRVIV